MLPQMQGVLKGWCKKKSIITYTQSIVDYEVVLLPTDYTAWINYQPMPSEKVNKKPEEQRKWIWWQILIDKSVVLKIDDWIVIDDKNFQVMEKSDWSQSGFLGYEAIEAFMPSTVE